MKYVFLIVTVLILSACSNTNVTVNFNAVVGSDNTEARVNK